MQQSASQSADPLSLDSKFLDVLPTALFISRPNCEIVTEPATVRQILEHVGERTTAPAIAPARSPLLEMNRHQLAAPERVFEAISKLEFD